MIVNTAALAKELSWVNRMVEKKTTIPILSNVMFEAERNVLRLTATNLEHALITELPAVEETPWKITAPAKLMLKYLQKITEAEVTLLPPKENNWLFLSHGAESKIEVAGMGTDSYPELPKLTVTGHLSGLKVGIPRAAFAISSEESRFTLNGALVEGDKKGARLVSTDGHRCSYVPITYKGPDLRALIHRRMLNELIHLSADSVGIGENEAHLLFEYGNRKMISRKLTGNFPDYHRVMPDQFPYAILVEADALYKLVDRVKLFADERSRCIHFNVEGGKLMVKASVCENGKASGSVPILGGAPSPTNVGLNADYVLDFLGLAKGETVAFCYPEMTIVEGQAPHVAGATQFMGSGNWSCVVMPIRV